jgi:hypothetical protein
VTFVKAMTLQGMWEVAEREAHRIGRVLKANHKVGYEEEEAGFKRAYSWFKNVAEVVKCEDFEEIIRKIQNARTNKIKEWVDAVD